MGALTGQSTPGPQTGSTVAAYGREERATERGARTTFLLHPTFRLVAIASLLAAAMLNRYVARFMGATVKPEHLALLGIWALLLVGAARWGWQLSARPLLWLVPFLGTLFLASALYAPDQATSLRQSVLVLLVSSGAVAVYCLASTPLLFRKVVQMLMVLGVLQAVITYAVLVADRFGFTFGTQPGNGYLRVPFGTLWEPNILGSYLSASAVLVLSALLAERMARRRLWLAICLGAMVAAVGLSLARASWLALPAGALVVVLLYFGAARRGAPALTTWSHNLRYPIIAGLAALVLLVGVAPLVFPDTFRGIFVRVDFRWYRPSQDPALETRGNLYAQAIEGIKAHPFIGTGAGSFAVGHTGEKGEPGWISNLELHLLYDSGLVGLCAVLGGLAVLLWQAVRLVLRPPPVSGGALVVPNPDSDLRPYTIGIVAAVVVLLIAYQTTEATWLAYTWPYVGLLARAANLGSYSRASAA